MVSSMLRATEKRLSPLLVSEGRVHGWAFDALREQVSVELFVDGQFCGSGLTGFKVLSDFFASAVPPTTSCGFELPLPELCRDGRTHRLQVKVKEWAPLHNAPIAELNWRHGACTGEWQARPDGAIEGWVAFVEPLEPVQLPRVQLLDALVPVATVNLAAEAVSPLPQFRSFARFRIDPEVVEKAGRETRRLRCLDVLLPATAESGTARIVGALEEVSLDGIRGWAFNLDDLRQLVELVIYVDGAPVMTVRPHVRRSDITAFLKLLPEEVGLAGFHVPLPRVLRDGRAHQVAVRAKHTATELETSPMPFRYRDGSFDLATAERVIGKPAEKSRKRMTAKQPVARKCVVSIVILNRNGEQCLAGLLESIERYNSVPVHFIVIDHASSDGSLALLESWRDRVSLEVVALAENRSFSESCNRGARLAKTPYLLFLNNDIVWVQDVLPRMLESLADRSVGLVGLQLRKTHGVNDARQPLHPMHSDVQHLGIQYALVDGCYWPFELSADFAPAAAMHNPRVVAGVTGAVMLCRTRQFLDAGGFDERYFYGYEDVELCLRWGAQLGLRSVCRNDLVALHHHGYTRLTGREPGVFDRQVNNQERLLQQAGLWLKRHFWRSLLQGDDLLTSERLKVAFIIDMMAAPSDHSELRQAVQLAQQLQQWAAGIEPLFVSTGEGMDKLAECHVIVAFDPAFDLRGCGRLRSDVRTAVVVLDSIAAERWYDNPGVGLFDRCLLPETLAKTSTAASLAAAASVRIGTPFAELQKLLSAELVRIAVHAGDVMRKEASMVVAALRQQDVIVVDGKTAWKRLADIELHCAPPTANIERWGMATHGCVQVGLVAAVAQVSALQATGRFAYLWVVNNNSVRRSAAAPKGVVMIDLSERRLRSLGETLKHYVDKQLGRTFSSP